MVKQSKRKMNWHYAMLWCKGVGGELAEISGIEDYERLKKEV
jgi:hypothetical protein